MIRRELVVQLPIGSITAFVKATGANVEAVSIVGGHYDVTIRTTLSINDVMRAVAAVSS